MAERKKVKKRLGILGQIYILVIFGMIIISVITYSSQYRIASAAVTSQRETFAFETATHIKSTFTDFPACNWLLRYWYEHADELDVEYDLEYFPGTETEKKYELLSSRNPNFHINYVTEETAAALSPEDQKLFAEVAYTWMITSLNQVKQSHNIDHLYVVTTDMDEGANPYGYQFFLLSAAGPGETRGQEFTDAFTIGKVIEVNEKSTVRETMRTAMLVDNGKPHHFDSSGNYADYYRRLSAFEDKGVLIGVSYSKSELTESIRSQARQGTNYAILYQVILINIIMLFMFLYEIKPLKKVLESITIYTANKDSKSVTENMSKILYGPQSIATRNNEVGQLAENFIDLAQEIDDYVAEIENITSKNQRIETELNVAANIQQSMLKQDFPLFADRSEFDVYALMDPAREIGGDFYDFIMVDEDHLVLVIADVAGKGVPAALFMMMAMVIVQSYSKMISSAAEILEKANDAICNHNESGMFVTVWIGILEISTGKMTCANAGHEYPAFMKAGSEFEMIRDKHCFVVGGMPEQKYREYTLQMEPGDKLYVYTDGVREAINTDVKMFGEDRILSNLNRLKDSAPKEIVKGMHSSIDAFAGEAEQFDDITMMCIEYFGTKDKG